MIKFNQIVRASVLSLTLAVGVGQASRAFAYDADDITDALNLYNEAINVRYDDQAMRDNIQDALDNQKNYCVNIQHMQDPGFCINDAEMNYEPQLDYWDFRLEDDQNAINDASVNYQYVVGHQNGIHGQP